MVTRSKVIEDAADPATDVAAHAHTRGLSNRSDGIIRRMLHEAAQAHRGGATSGPLSHHP